jgi:hypothetical protein
VLAQPGADLLAVERLDHQPPARREHAPELAERKPVALAAHVAKGSSQAQHRAEGAARERQLDV